MVDVLLGLQWGDEGKGKIVDYFAKNYEVIARFQGGPNAGHTLYVNGKKCRYIFCICTQNNKDESWTSNNEAWILTRKLSSMLWRYYNKHSDWEASLK